MTDINEQFQKMLEDLDGQEGDREEKFGVLTEVIAEMKPLSAQVASDAMHYSVQSLADMGPVVAASSIVAMMRALMQGEKPPEFPESASNTILLSILSAAFVAIEFAGDAAMKADDKDIRQLFRNFSDQTLTAIKKVAERIDE